MLERSLNRYLGGLVLDPISIYRADEINRYRKDYPTDPNHMWDMTSVTLPISMAPELIDQESIEALKKIEEELGHTINLQLCVAHAVSGEANENKIIPFHCFTMFDYDDKTFLGPAMPSLGHSIMTAPDLSAETKQGIIEESLLELLPTCNGIVIAMPQRKEGSFTDRIFTGENLQGVSFSIVDDPASQYYFFESYGTSDAILRDPKFIEIIQTINTVWNNNFAQFRSNTSSEELEVRRQITTNYIHNVFTSD